MPDENPDEQVFSDRAISFLREGLGKSDDEIEELREDGDRMIELGSEEQENASEPAGAPVLGEDGEDGSTLNEVLEALHEERERVEEHLGEVAVGGEDAELVEELQQNVDDVERSFGCVVDENARLEEQNEEVVQTYRRDLEEVNRVLEELLENTHSSEEYRELNRRVERISEEIEDVLMTEDERRRSREMTEYFRSAPRLTDY